MLLLTKPIREQLVRNHEENLARILDDGNTVDHKPVVKFFGGSSATWLITEYDPETELMFGLCDPGLGIPEVGSVSFAELKAIAFPPLGLPIERDRYWTAKKTLSAYASEARTARRIIA